MSWKTARIPSNRTSKSSDFVFRQETTPEKYQKLLSCKLCKKKLSCEMKLFQHMFTHKKTATYNRRRFRGQQSIPLREKPFKCETCKSSFSQETTLRLHLLSHDSETFSCEICLVEFPTLGCLQKHCLVEHELEQREDKKKAKRKPVAKVSEYTKKHKNDLVEQEENIATQSNKDSVNVSDLRERCLMYVDHKIFPCQLCGMFFSTEKNYEEHLLAHDFTRPTSKKRPGYIKRIGKQEIGDALENENCEFLSEKPMLESETQESTLVNFSNKLTNKEVLVESKKLPKKSVRRKKEVHICEVCQRQLTSRRNLTNHLKIHAANYSKGKKFKCHCIKNESECNDPLPHQECETTKDNFTFNHKKSESNNYSSFTEKSEDKDDACYNLTERTEGNDVTGHQANKEVGNNYTSCGSKESGGNYRCRSNKKAVKEEFKCNVCNKIYRLKIALMSHLMSHSTPKPKCEVCQKEFVSNKLLKLHFRSHSDIRFFFCEVCNKGFKHKHNLRIHFITHTDEKPYVCDVCNRAFKHKWGLKDHSLIHEKEPPFVCVVCNMGFFVKGAHKRHLLQHKEDMAFKCQYCGLGYNFQYQLKKHVTIYHGVQAVGTCNKGSSQDPSESNREIVSSMESNHEVELSMESSQEIEPSMKSNQANELSMVPALEIEPSASHSTMEIGTSSKEMMPSFVPCQGIEPSMVCSQEFEPSIVTSQKNKSSMVFHQAIEPPIVSNKATEPSIASIQDIKKTKPSRKMSTKDSETMVPFKDSTQGNILKMSLKESSKEIRTGILAKGTNLEIPPCTTVAEIEESEKEKKDESSQDFPTEAQAPIVTEMIFEESNDEYPAEIPFVERDELCRELTMQMLLKQSLKKEIIHEDSCGSRTETPSDKQNLDSHLPKSLPIQRLFECQRCSRIVMDLESHIKSQHTKKSHE